MGSKNSQKGFTLVELSIVIVIIGLIVAGVTAGQTLVKQAQIRAILTQADQVRAAVNAFKLQYNGLPGDITNASTYWPTTSSTTTFCSATAATPAVAADCDGDGNKQITVAALAVGEQYMAWYHLGRANLFPGRFVPGAALLGVINGNIPASKFPGAGITLGYGAVRMLTSTPSSGAAKNIILFGAPTAADIANGAFLTPAQAYALDAKADDASTTAGAVTGSILGGVGASGALDACALAGAYVVSATGATCSLGFAL